MTRVMLLALVLALTAAAARADDAPAVQRVTLGDAHVQSHLSAMLVVDTASVGTTLTTDADIKLMWRTEDGRETVLEVRRPTVLLPVAPHSTATYSYWLTARDRAGRFELRIPAAPGVFRVKAEAPAGPSVIDGTGDGPAPMGERIPVKVRLSSPESVADVTLNWRSRGTHAWTTAPMAVDGKDAWTHAIPRPVGQDVTVEYFVTARDTAGRVTHYGLPDEPHRLKLTAPAAPIEADQ